MGQPVKHEPTPAEIRAACLRIQAGWSDADREKRSGGEAVAWAMPTFVFDVDGVAEVVENAI